MEKEPIVKESIVPEPVAKTPVAQEPVAQEPVVQEPVAQEPIAQEPATPAPVPAPAQLPDDEWEDVSTSSTAGDAGDVSPDKIVLPKHTAPQRVASPQEIAERITSKRLPSRSFRVVSVGGSRSTSGNASATANATETPEPTPAPAPAPQSDAEALEKLESEYDALSAKTGKLQKEIAYLSGMATQGNLEMGDARKLQVALVRLQEYLDRKTKQRYEVGVRLSRLLRRQIDRGENGQFWIGNK